jgi:hypothetical protein
LVEELREGKKIAEALRDKLKSVIEAFLKSGVGV